jgi:hypothetical protein
MIIQVNRRKGICFSTQRVKTYLRNEVVEVNGISNILGVGKGAAYFTSAKLSSTLIITAMPPSELYPTDLSASTSTHSPTEMKLTSWTMAFLVVGAAWNIEGRVERHWLRWDFSFSAIIFW